MIGSALAKRTVALLLGACIGLAASGAILSTQPAPAPRTPTGTSPAPAGDRPVSQKERPAQGSVKENLATSPSGTDATAERPGDDAGNEAPLLRAWTWVEHVWPLAARAGAAVRSTVRWLEGHGFLPE
ncbi:MAG: hypothetical protein WBS54_14925 [Acidobacteriota bacterium]